MRPLLFGLALTAGLGCTGVQPAGPLAKVMKPKPAPAADKAAERPAAAELKPAPPALLITPGEVTADPQAAAQKLTTELEYDRRSLQAQPIVSAYKGGEKVR